MIEKSKVMVRIEYERGENKLNELQAGEEKENFICLTNDGKIALIDKEVILSLKELETKLTVYERNGMGVSTSAAKKELRIRS